MQLHWGTESAWWLDGVPCGTTGWAGRGSLTGRKRTEPQTRRHWRSWCSYRFHNMSELLLHCGVREERPTFSKCQEIMAIIDNITSAWAHPVLEGRIQALISIQQVDTNFTWGSNSCDESSFCLVEHKTHTKVELCSWGLDLPLPVIIHVWSIWFQITDCNSHGWRNVVVRTLVIKLENILKIRPTMASLLVVRLICLTFACYPHVYMVFLLVDQHLTTVQMPTWRQADWCP